MMPLIISYHIYTNASTRSVLVWFLNAFSSGFYLVYIENPIVVKKGWKVVEKKIKTLVK